jgi:hypothetical protein
VPTLAPPRRTCMACIIQLESISKKMQCLWLSSLRMKICPTQYMAVWEGQEYIILRRRCFLTPLISQSCVRFRKYVKECTCLPPSFLLVDPETTKTSPYACFPSIRLKTSGWGVYGFLLLAKNLENPGLCFTVGMERRPMVRAARKLCRTGI